VVAALFANTATLRVISPFRHRSCAVFLALSAATTDNADGQLVGGGPRPEQATLIRGTVTREKLAVELTDVAGMPLGTWEYGRRAAV